MRACDIWHRIKGVVVVTKLLQGIVSEQGCHWTAKTDSQLLRGDRDYFHAGVTGKNSSRARRELTRLYETPPPH
jgi:hypothetical protein